LASLPVGTLARWKYGKDEQNNTITRMQALVATAFSFLIYFIVYLYLLKFKILNRIHVSSFFSIIMKMLYPRIRIHAA
jgi:high-affinity Fe2+/Pb2+ permease